LLSRLPACAFGVILGWVIGHAAAWRPGASFPPAPTASPAPAEYRVDAAPCRVPRRVAACGHWSSKVQQRPPPTLRPPSSIANVYFDAERWDDAIEWYERALVD
jgi:hypothetical protein